MVIHEGLLNLNGVCHICCRWAMSHSFSCCRLIPTQRNGAAQGVYARAVFKRDFLWNQMLLTVSVGGQTCGC